MSKITMILDAVRSFPFFLKCIMILNIGAVLVYSINEKSETAIWSFAALAALFAFGLLNHLLELQMKLTCDSLKLTTELMKDYKELFNEYIRATGRSGRFKI